MGRHMRFFTDGDVAEACGTPAGHGGRTVNRLAKGPQG